MELHGQIFNKNIMKIEKTMESYEVSDQINNISISGFYNVLRGKLDYVKLTASKLSELINDPSESLIISNPEIIGQLEYKALIGNASTNTTNSDAYIPLINTFEQIKKNVNSL